MTDKPIRLQLSRAKGFRIQEASMAANGLPVIKVDRTTRWGNRYKVGERFITRKFGYAKVRDAEHAVELFRSRQAAHMLDMAQLRGKNLACWCPLPAPGARDICHAVVLIEIANRPICEAVP